MSFASSQKGSPLTLVSVQHLKGSLFSVITARNTGAKPIAKVQFGVLVIAKDAPAPVYRESALISVDLPVGESKAIEANVLSSTEAGSLMEKYQQGAEAEAGVVKVVYEDGSSWSFDAVRTGRFREGRALAQASACGGWLSAGLESVAHAFGIQHWYTCTDVDGVDQWCELKEQGQQCTDTICDPKKGQCPNQRCMFH